MAIITGTSGNNTLLGTNAVDTIRGLAGNDRLEGGNGNDRLDGAAGNDMLIGGAGVDSLFGGAGNDIYEIDNATEIDKTVADAGIDTVKSAVTYTLGAQQENLTLTGSTNLNGTGNNGNNILLGNTGNNTLTGVNGNDILNGGTGNDTLNGGAGNDRLLGGGGNDTLTFDSADTRGVDGGAGTDTLRVQGDGVNADLVSLNATTQVFTNIDVINLGAAGAQTVVLNAATIDGLNSDGTIRIKGTDADAVESQDLWINNGAVSIDSVDYTEYQNGTVMLNVQSGMDTSGIVEATVNVQLSAINGSNGFRISGEAEYDNSGRSVSSAGDVNGDGFDDLIIGAFHADPNGTLSGASYVVFAQESGFGSDLNLSTLNGTNGFQMSGVAEYDLSGSNVSAAGDVNGDGFGDLIVSGGGAEPNGSYSGASYVVFGRESGFASNLDLSALNGTNGFQISGETGDRAGAGVSLAGDVDGDGLDDLIISAGGADPNGTDSGASYVVFGKASGFASNLDVSALNGANGFQISAEAGGDYLGDISSAGDVNGDGFDDLIVGAIGADPNGSFSGASYVVFGSAAGFASNLNLSALNGSNGFQLSGEADDFSGVSVSAAGDVNGDGFGDVIVGAINADPSANNSGASYVVFGKAAGFASNLNLSALNGVNGFQISGEAEEDTLGRSVASAGDVNGDGFDDLILGVQYAAPNGNDSGASYLVFGQASGFASNLDLSALNGSNGFQISGAGVSDLSGVSVSSAGDVNGDGYDDLIVGAHGVDPAGEDSGASYVLFGRDFRNEVDFEGGGDADSFSGTAAGEIVIGGLGNDTLNGGGGADVVNGGGDNDILNGDGGADRLEGGAGDDAVNGGAGADRIEGDEGVDTLDGGLGNDVLIGGGDNDIFLFSDALGATNVDTIMDFGGAGATALDVIHLENTGIFTALAATGELSATNFVANAGGTAADSNDFIVYNTTTGALFYDADGNGGGTAVQFALIASDVDGLTAADFVVI